MQSNNTSRAVISGISPFPLGAILFIVVVALAIAGTKWLMRHHTIVAAKADMVTTSTLKTIDLGPRHEKIVAKGIYITGSTAASEEKRAQILKLLDTTELNSVVLDIKDSSGYIQYVSPAPHAMWFGKPIMKDPAAIVHEFHTHGVYVIGRIVVFEDPPLAAAHPEWTIQSAGGTPWKNDKGISWVDPTNKNVWDYNLAIARDAANLGFDELNFDYVRFPTDGNLNGLVYSQPFTSRHDAMNDFFSYMSSQLSGLRPYLSFDLFGMTVDNKELDLGIGQRIKDVKVVADYIDPMMYPSHYPPTYRGFKNPADFPYEVIHLGLLASDSQFTTTTRALMRPWIQAFNLGAVYDGAKIRSQIKAVEEDPHTAGWLLWNARNVYTSAGLLPN